MAEEEEREGGEMREGSAQGGFGAIAKDGPPSGERYRRARCTFLFLSFDLNFSIYLCKVGSQINYAPQIHNTYNRVPPVRY
jgi:hypothetical protein